MADQSYDFIIVGSGPAGAAVAWQLAESPKQPRVLLLEAGPPNDDIKLRIEGHKFFNIFKPEQAWGYKSQPNAGLNGRELDLNRGKGLGGSSMVNFTVWTEGLAEDMENMAKATGDDAWKWERVKERYKKLITMHDGPNYIETEREKYIASTPGNYGTNGPLHLGYSQVFDKEMLGVVDMWEQSGAPLRSDVNDGTLLGIGIYPLTGHRGTRTTSADLISDPPPNLEVITDAPVHRVLFEGNRAIGVMANSGRTFKASKEVILSAGTMESPKILLHSGIGPASQLAKFDIPLLHHNPNVGENFQDHILASLRFERPAHTSTKPAYFTNPAAQKAAFREWELFRTGPLATMGTTLGINFCRSKAVLESAEFAALPKEKREFIASPNVPSFEIGCGLTDFSYIFAPSSKTTFPMFLVLQNLQSRGSFTLQSSDPSVPLLFDTKYLEHPFDQRVAIESYRQVRKILHEPPFSDDFVAYLGEAKSDSDEDILAWWRQGAITCFHMSSTCTMGRDEVKDKAVVDEKFRVFGVQGLRVADSSIWPVLPAGHIQAHSYQAGMIAAEKLIEEYGLA